MMPVKSDRRSLTIVLSVGIALLAADTTGTHPAQESFPEPPRDLTRVYYLGADSKLRPLPFEAGVTTVNVFLPAKKDAVVRVILKGPSAETIVDSNVPRFYVFVADKMDPPPHQLVRLTSKRSARELAISVIKGRRGYAPFETDSVRLEHRILKRLRVETTKGRFLFINYLQMRPVRALEPGEYAIIGDSLSDMATFRIP